MRACQAFVFVLCLVAASACSDSSPSAPGGRAVRPADGAHPQLAGRCRAALHAPPDARRQQRHVRPELARRSTSSRSPTGAIFRRPPSARSRRLHGVAQQAEHARGHRRHDLVHAGRRSPAHDALVLARAHDAGHDHRPTGRRRRTLQLPRSPGISRPGELYDPLIANTTIGTPVGSTTFVAGKGIRINDRELLRAVSTARKPSRTAKCPWRSRGCIGNGPGAKLKIFSMIDGTGNLLASKYLLQRSVPGTGRQPRQRHLLQGAVRRRGPQVRAGLRPAGGVGDVAGSRRAHISGRPPGATKSVW